MSQLLSNEDLRMALEECAAEQVHIPGHIQPYACMVVIDPKSRNVTHASANTQRVFGVPPFELLGHSFEDRLDRAVWHKLQNVLALPTAATRTHAIGEAEFGGTRFAVQATLSDGLVVMEFEPQQDLDQPGIDPFATLGELMEDVDACEDEASLHEAIVLRLQHLTGYDRVMVYRFDHDWNGEVQAEAARHGMQSYIGLRFPHWDIPAQARAIMAKIPLRFISDVDQMPVPLMAARPDAPPLDMTYANARGVSSVHLEYLKNMGSQATLTISVVVGGKLWGIISFHHEKPRVPGPDLRALLTRFGQVFSSKLHILQQQARLALVTRVDRLKDELLADFEDEAGFDTFAERVLDILDADGLVITQDQTRRIRGQVPDASVIEDLTGMAGAAHEVQSFDSLREAFPSFANAMNGCAGAILFAPVHDRSFLVFRSETTREITWAGNPEKTVEQVDDRLRLSPRGSFSTYLAQLEGHAKPWSDEDLYFSGRIWTILNSVERQMLITSLNRQQKILIDELNHRVRNILALVRSVSQQARRSSYGTLESYSKSLEARFQALAASHNLASGSVVSSVNLAELIATEFEPFGSDRLGRAKISGPDKPLRAEVAPIFSLVIHELVTNAVKYGALSNDTGTVTLTLSERNGGLALDWLEQGGPAVKPPAELGFGSTLIKEAIPYELEGTSDLIFAPGGVEAHVWLPPALFDTEAAPIALQDVTIRTQAEQIDEARPKLAAKTCLLVEDNFVIARGLRDQIKAMGVDTVEMAPNAHAALRSLSAATPDFAILDVNLGERGETSLPVADELLRQGIAFVFLTGYGDSVSIPDGYEQVTRLTKPATDAELITALVEAMTRARVSSV